VSSKRNTHGLEAVQPICNQVDSMKVASRKCVTGDVSVNALQTVDSLMSILNLVEIDRTGQEMTSKTLIGNVKINESKYKSSERNTNQSTCERISA
jgi:hypothetical protein